MKPVYLKPLCSHRVSGTPLTGSVPSHQPKRGGSSFPGISLTSAAGSVYCLHDSGRSHENVVSPYGVGMRLLSCLDRRTQPLIGGFAFSGPCSPRYIEQRVAAKDRDCVGFPVKVNGKERSPALLNTASGDTRGDQQPDDTRAGYYTGNIEAEAGKLRRRNETTEAGSSHNTGGVPLWLTHSQGIHPPHPNTKTRMRRMTDHDISVSRQEGHKAGSCNFCINGKYRYVWVVVSRGVELRLCNNCLIRLKKEARRLK